MIWDLKSMISGAMLQNFISMRVSLCWDAETAITCEIFLISRLGTAFASGTRSNGDQMHRLPRYKDFR